ncbi:MAG: PAS domain S-box protein, partial [Desulfobacterales bacterium]
MQIQTIKALIVAPSRDDFSKVQDLLHRIKKWRVEAQWASDFDAAIRHTDESDYGIIFVDDHIGHRVFSNLIAALEKEACITPVILLISNHEPLDDFEAAIGNTAEYLEKATLNVYELERSIRYAVALKKTAEQLRESELRLRGIFYGAAIGIALFGLEGQIVEPNPALSKITGFSREELCSFSLKDLFGRSAGLRITERYSELIEDRQDILQVEEHCKHKDGKDLWIRLTISHFMNDKIPAKFAVGLFEDITEPKQAEEE